jgi:DNA-binding NarL/FixJ family response regulator
LTRSITIILADDHALVRHALRHRLCAEPGFEVLADVSDAGKALDAVRAHHPDVLLMDIDMPGPRSIDVARTIRDEAPETRIVFLSAFCFDRYIQEALRLKAAGYVTKTQPAETIIEAIRNVMAGATFYSPEVRSRIVVRRQGADLLSEGRTRLATLAPREREVLRYLAQGLGKKEIADRLHRSIKTVDGHCARLMNKLDIHDRVELTRFAIREGLLPANP